MIKKLLSSVLFVASVGVASSFGQAICTPNISCVPADSTFGICPDSVTGLAHGIVGVAYTQTMSIKIPGTTVVSGQTLPLTHLALTQVMVDTATSGSAVWVDCSVIGLTYLGNGANSPQGGAGAPNGYTMTKYCYWPAPDSSCVIVSGTPTKAGTFRIKILSYARATFSGFGSWAPAPDNTHYKIIIAPGTTGVEEEDMSKFEVMQNAPNPFSEKTEIRFNSPSVNAVDFKVYNLVGAVVYTESVKAEKGSNTITLKANAFAPGVYMYAIKNGSETITKRMVVTQ
jgi:hypothetical protein